MKVLSRAADNGLVILFYIEEGKNQTEVKPPFSKELIQLFYKLKGFQQYVAWEELQDSGVIDDGVLLYEKYYELLKSEEGTELIGQIGLPTAPIGVEGRLSLTSLPEEAKLKLALMDDRGRNLDRIGKNAGAVYEIDQELVLLPEAVYQLKHAIDSTEEEGYQKIGICQQKAKEAGISLENFLQNETYHVVDQYDLTIQVHNDQHIELIPAGQNELETAHLQNGKPVSSRKNQLKRDRFVSTNHVQQDVQLLQTKRHITGSDVPVFLENPSAVLPEHEYTFDLEAFSERVKGLIPIEHAWPRFTEGGKIQWFDEETDKPLSYDTDFLRGLMEKHPDDQYVQHEGRWIYLDPVLRKKLLDIPPDEENQLKTKFMLDIIDNEEKLDYSLEHKDTDEMQLEPIPVTLQADLFDHQKEGFRWICQLAEREQGGLLADDMGLGKTIQVIAFLLAQKAKNKLNSTLVVLPIALIENWVEEIHKFAPELSNSIYIHRGPSRYRSSGQISRFDIVFTSYDTLKIDQLILGKIKFQAIICDEAQNGKSHTSQRSRALRAMQTNFRLAMTGTPVENSLEELWTIMDFVQPGSLGSLREFRKRFIDSADYEGLLTAIQPCYLRRTKQQVLSDRLPKKFLLDPIKTEASPLQKQIANSMLATKETGQIAILNMLMKMRQLYGHPGTVIPSYEQAEAKSVPKLKELISIVEKVREKSEKVIIFTEFKKINSILKQYFMRQYGISVPVIDGETKNRQAVVKSFNESSGFGIMLLSPKAAGVGLTITSANHVVHYTRWWNPAVENQATDRAYRIGQQKDVYVYQIITTDRDNFPNGTVEELMHELLESKKDLAENIVVPFSASDIQKEVIEILMKKSENTSA